MMDILLYILAVPLGAVIFAGVLFLCGVIATYPGESFAVVLLLIVSFGIGAWALGLPPVW